jgi:hypothetical protein
LSAVDPIATIVAATQRTTLSAKSRHCALV